MRTGTGGPRPVASAFTRAVAVMARVGFTGSQALGAAFGAGGGVDPHASTTPQITANTAFFIRGNLIHDIGSGRARPVIGWRPPRTPGPPRTARPSDPCDWWSGLLVKQRRECRRARGG